MDDPFITDREVLAVIPKSEDVDARVSLVALAGTRVLEVQDVVRSTGHIGRGWYCIADNAGRACAGQLAGVLAAFAGEPEL
jgi:hypothetical protein